MLDILITRIRQKNRTVAFPKRPPELPDRFRGLPLISAEKCRGGCEACKSACPAGAISIEGPPARGQRRIRIDL
jgi:formate hydrogenlyase subunit 6/NADH:ubiquinone oxidoreductase subunit I